MNESDAAKLIEIVIWPIVAMVVVFAGLVYHLAKLAITGKPLAERQGETPEQFKSRIREDIIAARRRGPLEMDRGADRG